MEVSSMNVGSINNQNVITAPPAFGGYTKKLEREAIDKLEAKYGPIAAANRRQYGVSSNKKLVYGTSEYLSLSGHVFNKYYVPGSPGYNPNLDEGQRSAAYQHEWEMTLSGEISAALGHDPLFRKKPLVLPYGDSWENVNYANEVMSDQLRSMFAKNNVLISWNTVLCFTVDPYDYNVSVTGIDDKSLINKIVELLNYSKNGAALFTYIYNSGSLSNSPTGSVQITDEQREKYYLARYIKDYTGLNMSDMQVVNGRFVMHDGKDLLILLEESVLKNGNEAAKQDLSFVKQKVAYFAKVGYDSVPSMNLQIEWSNGELINLHGRKSLDVKA